MTKPTAASGAGTAEKDVVEPTPINDTAMDIEIQKPDLFLEGDVSGSSKMEAMTLVWGKYGRVIILAALVFSMIAYEYDNTTVYTYYVYAQSSFKMISSLAALKTAGGLCFAVLKPLVAKLSDVFGRGELYPVWILLYILAHILCSKSPNFETYATGYIFHIFAQTGVNTLNDILAADISTARQRGLAVQLQFLPYMVMPFVSAFITDSVVNSIGWRWGIGMLCIIMPVGFVPLIFAILGWQRKAKKAGFNHRTKLSVYDFFSQIDMGGMTLFCGGLALILLPATLAGKQPDGWKTAWVIACLVAGCVFLTILPFYEKFYARHPIVPLRYFKDPTITMALLIYAMDGIATSVTHSYFYTWCIVARGYSIRDANLISDALSVMQLFTGLSMGAIMWWTRRYKWVIAAGGVIRMIGFGVMFRVRTGSSSTAELVIVQLIQGIGNGLMGTGCFVAATVAVPHKEVAQMTAVAVCLSTLGSTIGSAIGGGIYTSQFKAELAQELGSMATPKLINAVFDSITTGLPAWGTVLRTAIAKAYNTVMGYFTYVAFGSTVPGLLLVWFLPNRILTDTQNLVEGQGPLSEELERAAGAGTEKLATK